MASKSPELTFVPTTAAIMIGTTAAVFFGWDLVAAFFVSAAAGLTVWLVLGTWLNGTATQVVWVVTICAGGWIGWLFAGGAGIALGLAAGVLTFLGWATARAVVRLIRWARLLIARL